MTYFIISAICVGLSVVHSYKPLVQNTYGYFIIGLSLALLNNFTWYAMSRTIEGPRKYVVAYGWDTMDGTRWLGLCG